MTVYARYQAYLLRIWRESPQAPWRASLQEAATGERYGFANLESLFAFLKAQVERVERECEEEEDLL